MHIAPYDTIESLNIKTGSKISKDLITDLPKLIQNDIALDTVLAKNEAVIDTALKQMGKK